MAVLSFLKESVFAEEYASKKGFLQSMDPRFKTIGILLFLLLVLLAKNIVFLAVMYLFCLILASCSKIKLGFFLKRTWIFMPLFSFFIAIPALFSAFTPGEAVWSYNIFGLRLIITRQGLFGAMLFVLRVVTSISFVILLALTTRHTELLRVLRIFRIPQIFVMTIGMCYRYIYLFIEIIEDTYLAIKSRVGFKVHYKKGQEIITWGIAHLWQRSYQLNNQVYNAMLSRGYRGEPKVLNEFKTMFSDWLWLIFAVLFFIIIVVMSYAGRV